jgi:hypothetical protein
MLGKQIKRSEQQLQEKNTSTLTQKVTNNSDIKISTLDLEEIEFQKAKIWKKIDCLDERHFETGYKFVGDHGLKISSLNSPLSYLQCFLDTEVVEMIIKETNNFAEQFLSTENSQQGRCVNWVDLNVKDFWIFVATMILQTLVVKPEQDLYWSKDELLHTPIFSEIMSEKRFSLIMKFLHFEKDDSDKNEDLSETKLKKISNLHHLIINNFKKTYVPNRFISIDESLMPFKGRLSWKQFIPSKRARFGIKFFNLCESDSGYIWNSIIYTGKNTKWNAKYSDYGVGTKVVLTLIESLLDKGHCLITDNYYTSPELFSLLINRTTDAYGTVKPSRNGLPDEMSRVKLRTGDVNLWKKGRLIAMKWKDKKDVYMLASINFRGNEQNASDTIKKQKKPSLVVEYNKTMGGVDRADQGMSYYSAMRRQQKKYYKKIFRHLLDQCIWNSYVLYKKNSSDKIKHLQFTLSLAREILKKFKKGEDTIDSSTNEPETSKLFRLTERHFIKHIPPTEKKATPSRRCVVCYSKKDDKGKNIRKETRFYCPSCDVGLCLDECFERYHTMEKY